ncbi:DNA double-strand break repair nuclease NurA [Candidatus Woesearchaeota archaeon]|nr:DNA double-strand break repair nuclease NurA [Candidatus Woesearchaeota archaeon]
MDQKLLRSLADKISPDTSKPSCIVLGKDGYTPAQLSLEHFKPIPAATKATIAFVDSGNAEIASGANFALHFIRTCVVVRDGKKITQEAFCLVQAAHESGKLVYRTELVGLEGIRLPTIDIYEPSLAEGTHKVQPSRVAELCRTLAEHLLAAWTIPELPVGAFLVRDGDLEAHTLYEQNALRELFERARIQGITIAGLSKTSSLLTDTGHAAIPVLASMAPAGTWHYHPIATSARPDHQASVCVAKLHAHAEHAFRIDIFDQHEPLLPELIAVLAAESADAAFLGYPYGLIEADRYARVREEERSYLRARAELAFGKRLKEHEAAKNAHDRLNSAV